MLHGFSFLSYCTQQKLSIIKYFANIPTHPWNVWIHTRPVGCAETKSSNIKNCNHPAKPFATKYWIMCFKGKIPHRANYYPQNGEHCFLGVFKMNESPMGIHSSDMLRWPGSSKLQGWWCPRSGRWTLGPILDFVKGYIHGNKSLCCYLFTPGYVKLLRWCVFVLVYCEMRLF